MRQHKQFFKILVVGALVALMSVNVTLARGWGWSSNRCCPRVCAPRPVCGYGWSGGWSGGWGGGWGGYQVGPVYYSSGRYSSGRIVIDAPLIEGPVVEEWVMPAPALFEEAPVEESLAEPAPESTDPMPIPPPMPESTEAPLEVAPMEVAPLEVAPMETPPLFETPSTIDETPAVESAPEIDDLFAPSTTPVEEAEEAPVEDLFGPSTTPVEEPEEMPAEEPFETPMDAPAETPVVEELTAPADDAPLMEEPLVEEPPAEESGFGDLFGPSSTPIEESEEPPAETPIVEELTAPADDAPLMEEPPVEEPSADMSDFNDLFGPPPTPAEEPEETPSEVEELPGVPAIENELFDDPQAASSTSVPGGLTSTELRNWTDSTLRYTIRGRLLWAKEGKVRILKETGRTTTLAVTRLCKADRQFVQAQAVAALQTLDVDNHTAQNR